MLGVALLAPLFIAGCHPSAGNRVSKPPKVDVQSPIKDDVIDYLDFTGRLEAVQMVELKARVQGYLNEMRFKDGALVKQNDVLFVIDPRPYEADLNQAEANLKLAEAESNLQKKNVVRAIELFKSKALAPEEYETVLATEKKAAASVGAAEAARDRAQLYVDYTQIRAPIDGRIGQRFKDPKNVILADNTVLATIVSEGKIYAYFDVDERTYLDYLGPVSASRRIRQNGHKMPVVMKLANETEFSRVGTLDFEDNRVTAGTGTIRLRAIFDDENGFLKAGLFGRVRLPIGMPYEALLIPEKAIQSDQERKYVWVVNGNQVKYRAVKLGLTVKDLRVILPPQKGMEGQEGLTLTDRVITSGVQRAKDGITVEAQVQSAPALPRMPLVQLFNEAIKAK